MAGAAGTHLLRRRRSSPRGLPLLLRCRRSSSPRGRALLRRRLGPPLPLRLRLERLPRRRRRSLLFLLLGLADSGFRGGISMALRGGFGARFAAPEAKIARARIGSATPTTNGSRSYNGRAESSIGVGARAAAVVERDDGCSLFLQ